MSNPENVDPAKPELSADATQRLTIGVPAAPADSEWLDAPQPLHADSTLKLPLGVPEPAMDQTQKLVIPRLDEPPIRRLKVDSPAEAAGQILSSPPPPQTPRSIGWKWPAAIGLLVVLGAGAFMVLPRGTGTTPATYSVTAVPATAAVPKDVQILIDQAKAGDTRAMRMLGAYYLHGLNVPKDREKGLYYYRMAAEKGSDAARAELSQIEGGR